LIEVLDSRERLGRIEVCVANKESELDRVILRVDVFQVCRGDLQRSNSIFAKSRPRPTQVGEHANLHYRLDRLKFCRGTGQSNNDCAEDEAEQEMNFH
jgi:hypothetical protein